MRLTSAEEIRLRLASYDKQWHDTKYAEMCYAFGEPDSTYSAGDAGFPWYPAVKNNIKEIGRSMRIMNTSMIAVAKTMYADPEPDFPKLSKVDGEFRKQFFKERYNGTFGTDGTWSEQCAQCFIEGYNLGLGFMQHGLKTNPLTGKQYVTVQHIPTINVIRDRHEIFPSRYRWIAFVKHLAPEDAEALFGSEVKEYLHTVDTNSADSKQFQVVRVIEYYDVGYGGREPTMAYILDDIGNDPVEITRSPYDFLPFTYYLHTLTPGVDDPVGMVYLQRNTQEALNDIERALRDHTKDNRPTTALKSEAFDPKDVKAWKKGLTDKMEVTDATVEDPIIRIGAMEAPQTLLQLYQIYERQWNADSGVNDLERGNLSTSARTLGENQLLDQRSQIQGGIAKKGVVKMFVRLVENTLRIAEKYDRDPVWIDALGTQVLINDPADPSTWIDNFLKTYSDVYISESSLEYVDHLKKVQERNIELTTIAPYFMNNPMMLKKLIDELLKNIGEDPKEWTQTQQDMMQNMQNQIPPDAVDKSRNNMTAQGLQLANKGV